ncbi:uncharacterized protein LOC131667625 [Phymastichus coffea]|uniref:uncharacterized protein LOC131667625 n=1 Tax=Phymastichus coffea TaxID=108790 RepID=UPI00273CD9E3|nr:uncharacterized protein LOC131667625 [Phymastichus coffea]
MIDERDATAFDALARFNSLRTFFRGMKSKNVSGVPSQTPVPVEPPPCYEKVMRNLRYYPSPFLENNVKFGCVDNKPICDQPNDSARSAYSDNRSRENDRSNRCDDRDECCSYEECCLAFIACL